MMRSAIIASIGQTSRIQREPVFSKKPLKANIKRASSSLVSRCLGSLSTHHTPLRMLFSSYFVTILRHRIAREHNIRINLISPDILPWLSASCKELQIWTIGQMFDYRELFFWFMRMLLLRAEHPVRLSMEFDGSFPTCGKKTRF